MVVRRWWRRLPVLLHWPGQCEAPPLDTLRSRAVMSSSGRTTKRGISWSGVCKLASQLPGVMEGTSYGTPALHVRKRFLARLKEDGETMAIKLDYADREVLLELDPRAFYLTDHYRPYPAILVRLKEVPLSLVGKLLEKAWRFQ